MHRWTVTMGIFLATATAADAQVIGGVMSVTQTHMS